MAERSDAYQRQIKDYLRNKLKTDSSKLNFSSDQEAYNYTLQQYAKTVAQMSGETKKPASQNIWMTEDSLGGLYATDMSRPDGDQLRIIENSTILPGDGSVLNVLVAMKPLNQSLPDFLRDRARRKR